MCTKWRCSARRRCNAGEVLEVTMQLGEVLADEPEVADVAIAVGDRVGAPDCRAVDKVVLARLLGRRPAVGHEHELGQLVVAVLAEGVPDGALELAQPRRGRERERHLPAHPIAQQDPLYQQEGSGPLHHYAAVIESEVH